MNKTFYTILSTQFIPGDCGYELGGLLSTNLLYSSYPLAKAALISMTDKLVIDSYDELIQFAMELHYSKFLQMVEAFPEIFYRAEQYFEMYRRITQDDVLLLNFISNNFAFYEIVELQLIA